MCQMCFTQTDTPKNQQGIERSAAGFVRDGQTSGARQTVRIPLQEILEIIAGIQLGFYLERILELRVILMNWHVYLLGGELPPV